MKKIHFFLFTLLLIFLVSCDGSKENPNNPNLATITFDANLSNIDIDPMSEFFVMASKSDGSLIDYKPIEVGQTVTLANPDYAESNFTLSIIEKNGVTIGKYLFGLSYQGIPRGIEIIIKDPKSETAEFVTLNSVNFNQNNSSYLFSLPGHYAECFEEESLTLLPSSKNSAPLYIVSRDIEGEDNGYLLTQTNYEVGQEYDVSLSQVFTLFTNENVTVSSGFEFASNYLYGRQINETPEYAYQLSFSDARLNQNNLAVKKPENLFQTYSSVNSAHSDILRYQSFSTTKAYDFEIPAYEILDFDTEPGLVNYSATSQDGYVGIYFKNLISGIYVDWLVTDKAGLGKTARVPELPSAIASFIPNYSNNIWLWDETFYLNWPDDQLALSDIVAFDMLGWMPHNVPTIDAKFLDVYVGDPVFINSKQNFKKLNTKPETLKQIKRKMQRPNKIY